MSYINFTKQKVSAAGECTVCLKSNECEIIKPVIEKTLLKERMRLERWIDIHESGEMTSRQQTSMVECGERVESLASILESITELLKNKQS